MSRVDTAGNGTEYPKADEIIEHLEKTGQLSDSAAHERGVILAEEIRRIRMTNFKLLPIRTLPCPETGGEVTLIDYEFGPVRFTVENAKDPHSVRRTVEEICGSGLDREQLLYFSKICQMARSLIPELWFRDESLLADIRDPGKHLSTLNEIWWLGRWKHILDAGPEREYRISASRNKTVDWRIPIRVWGKPWFVNLEVKCLVGSIADRSYQRPHFFYRAIRSDGTPNEDDPRLKFRRSELDEINVVAITWFDLISTQLEAEIQRFLDETDVIDAVAIWAPGDHERGSWLRRFPTGSECSEKRKALHQALKEPDDEDHTRIMSNPFPRTFASIVQEASLL